MILLFRSLRFLRPVAITAAGVCLLSVALWSTWSSLYSEDDLADPPVGASPEEIRAFLEHLESVLDNASPRLKDILAAPYVRYDPTFGFDRPRRRSGGVRRVSFAFPVSVALLVEGFGSWSRVLAVEVTLLSEHLAEIDKDRPIGTVWSRRFEENDDLGVALARSRWADQPRVDAWARRVARNLDPSAAPLIPPSTFEPDYRALTDPLSGNAFGDRCGFVSTKPAPRRAVEALVEGQQWNIIRAVLRGPLPEGRIYAAEALLKANMAVPSDVAVMRELMADDADVLECGGCAFSTTTTAEVLQRMLGAPK